MKKDNIQNYTKTVDRIARKFSGLLKKEINRASLQEVIQRNKNQQNKNICHSHDFCDANMVMNEAIESVLNKSLDINSTYHQNLWNDGWDLAKKYNFFTQ